MQGLNEMHQQVLLESALCLWEVERLSSLSEEQLRLLTNNILQLQRFWAALKPRDLTLKQNPAQSLFLFVRERSDGPQMSRALIRPLLEK